MTKSEIESKYNEVGCVLQDSLSKAKSINLLGEEEKMNWQILFLD